MMGTGRFCGKAKNVDVAGALDRAEARRALAVFAGHPHKVELRPLPSARSVVLPATQTEELIDAADAAEAEGNTVYFTPNPVEGRGNGKASRDADAVSRAWLLFDLDPIKAAGFEKCCATDAEKNEAGALCVRLSEHLSGLGFPMPVQIDSGNGYYLFYRLDLPNDEIVKALVKRATKNLKALFDGPGAVIDPTVTNCARIVKLPGTLNRKGENTPERPHRRCRVVGVPDVIEGVRLGQLQALAGVEKEQKPPEANGSAFSGKAKDAASDAYGRKALAAECGRVLLAIPGPREGRNNALNRAAFSLGQLVAGGVLTRAEVEAALRQAAASAGLEEAEVEATIKSGIEAGMAQPRGIPEKAKPHETNGKHEGKADAPASDVVAYRASTVTPRKVEWLWPRRIPLGKLTTFAGMMGIGKTFLLCDLTARLSAGLEWPDLPGDKIEPADVLFISGEDDPEDTLVPRMIECGADLSRVWFLHLNALSDFTLASLGTLDKAAAQAAALKLVVIDPPTSYLGGVDDHKNADLRRLLTPLKHWTAENRASCVFNSHLNKAIGQKVEAIFRVIGSVAWMAAVRAGHLIAEDPDDRERRIFVPMKSNLGKKAGALAYTIVDAADERGKLTWLGAVDVTANQAVNGEKAKPRRVVASEWLLEQFREKREWPSDDLFKAAKEANVSRSALFEAKDSLDLPKARKVTHENGNVCWTWWVPEDWPPLTPPAEGEGEVA